MALGGFGLGLVQIPLQGGQGSGNRVLVEDGAAGRVFGFQPFTQALDAGQVALEAFHRGEVEVGSEVHLLSLAYAVRYTDKYSVNVDAMQGVMVAILPRDSALGEWIREKFRSQAKFAEKLGVDPTRLSRWMNRVDGISDDYQAKIRKLGYTGPWPREEAQEAPAPAGGPYVTEKDFAEWRGYWRGGMEALLKRVDDLEDQVRKLRQPGASA